MPKARPFAVFDIDGTLIRWQLYHAIADALAREGHISTQEHDVIRNARMEWKKRTHEEAFKSYENEVIIAFEGVLRRITREQLDAAIDAVFSEYKDQVYTYSRELLKELKLKGYWLWAISGSQTEIVRRIADYYGFDDCLGTDYEYLDGQFTGNKDFVATDKAAALKRLVQAHRATYANSLAVGDSESDIPMLKVVDQPIAFNPTRRLYAAALEYHWPIVVERKNVTYLLQPGANGYELKF